MTTATEPTRLERVVPGIGTIEFVETEKRREYWLLPEGGQRRSRLPSVTSILRQTWPKPALLEWYAKHGSAAEGLLQTAADRGKAVHKFVETYMASGALMDTSEFPESFRPYLQGVAKFLWEFDPQPIAVERLVCHPEYRYAGRLDLIAAIHGVPTLLDFKSNPKGRIYPEAHVQAHAYALADHRCGSERVEATLLVGIAEDGTYTPVIGQDASKLWQAVLGFHGQLQRFEKGLDGAS